MANEGWTFLLRLGTEGVVKNPDALAIYTTLWKRRRPRTIERAERLERWDLWANKWEREACNDSSRRNPWIELAETQRETLLSSEAPKLEPLKKEENWMNVGDYVKPKLSKLQCFSLSVSALVYKQSTGQWVRSRREVEKREKKSCKCFALSPIFQGAVFITTNPMGTCWGF